MRPSRRMSFLSLASSSSACASSARLDLTSTSDGMVWGDMMALQKLPGGSQVWQFFAAAQDEERGGSSLKSPSWPGAFPVLAWIRSNPAPGPFPIAIPQATLEDLAGIL